LFGSYNTAAFMRASSRGDDLSGTDVRNLEGRVRRCQIKRLAPLCCALREAAKEPAVLLKRSAPPATDIAELQHVFAGPACCGRNYL